MNRVTTNYTVDDNNNITEQSDVTNDIKFAYDASGKLEFMTLDSNGKEMVTYSYDSCGKLLNIGSSLKDTVGTLNPMRYHYYDAETGLYYL